MRRKLLFREALVQKSKENPQDFVLEYYLVTTGMEHNGVSLETYGIEIVKRVIGSAPVLERKTLEDIFLSREKAWFVLDALHRNLVTPVTLVDVIEDLLAFDFEILEAKKGA